MARICQLRKDRSPKTREYRMPGVIERNNVHICGAGERAMMFAHGFGCDQNMWRFVAPAFEKDFTHCPVRPRGRRRLGPWRLREDQSIRAWPATPTRSWRSAESWTCEDAVFVGHSVSGMIGVLAAGKAPGMFGKLVLVGPSARYIDDEGYKGRLQRETDRRVAAIPGIQSHGLVGADGADRSWVIRTGRSSAQELTNSFCRTDPEIAKAFARVTFTSDNREDLAGVAVPTLVLQCSEDIIAAQEVGDFVNRTIPNSRMIVLKATGHCPNLSAPGRSHFRDANLRVTARERRPTSISKT